MLMHTHQNSETALDLSNKVMILQKKMLDHILSYIWIWGQTKRNMKKLAGLLDFWDCVNHYKHTITTFLKGMIQGFFFVKISRNKL